MSSSEAEYPHRTCSTGTRDSLPWDASNEKPRGLPSAEVEINVDTESGSKKAGTFLGYVCRLETFSEMTLVASGMRPAHTGRVDTPP